MENKAGIIGRIKGLEKTAKIRLVIFAAIMIWCVFLSVSYTCEVSFTPLLARNMIDLNKIDNINIDGSDFTFAAFLLGAAANTMIMAVLFAVIAVYTFLTAILSLIPVLLLRFIGIRKTTAADPFEYRLSRAIYFIGIGASLVIGLIVTKLTGVLPLLLFTGICALMTLIYILGLRKTQKKNGVPPAESPGNYTG